MIGRHIRSRSLVMLAVGALLLALVATRLMSGDPEAPSEVEEEEEEGSKSELARRHKVPANPIALRALAGRQVSGTVLEAGEPVANATVTIRLPQLAGVAATSKTGDDGTFDLGKIDSRTGRLTVEADGRATETMRLSIDDPTLETESLEIELESCELGGIWTIVNDEQRPLPDAKIDSYAMPPDGILVARRSVNRDAEIRFCKNGRTLGHSVVAKGYGTSWIGAHKAADGGSIQLSSGGSMKGFVTDHGGTPLPNTKVMLRASGPGMSLSSAGVRLVAYTDAHGEFFLEDLRPGTYLVGAYPYSMSPRPRGTRAVVHANTTEYVSVVVEESFAVSGVVLKGDTPEPGIDLWIDKCARTVSQKDGSFATRCAEDELSRDVRVSGFRDLGAADVELSGATNDLLVELQDEPTVSGRVLLSGAPVAGAKVGSPWDSGDGHIEADRLFPYSYTDNSGKYELELRTGDHNIVACDEIRNICSRPTSVELDDKANVSQDLELTLHGAIRGRVLGADGAPIPGAYVTLGKETLGERVDMNGSFRFLGLALGEHTLTVEISRGDEFSGQSLSRIVSLTEDQPLSDLEIRTDRAPWIIKGLVRYDDGSAVVGATVSTDSDVETTSDASGAFRLRTYSSGATRVEAKTAFGERAEAVADEDSTMVELTLQRSGSIAGTTSALDGTEVIAEVQTSGIDAMFSKMRAEQNGVVVREGRFDFPSVPAGTYELTATVGLTISRATAVVRPAEEAEVTLGEVEGTLISGRAVRHRDGLPVARALCGRQSFGNVFSNKDGHFELRPGASSTKVIVLCRSGVLLGAVALDLVPNTAAAFDVPMVASPGFLGAVLRADSPTSPVVVQQIEPESPAARSGVRKGDHVREIDGLATSTLSSLMLMSYLAARPPGVTMAIGIERDGTERQLQIVLGEAQPAR